MNERKNTYSVTLGLGRDISKFCIKESELGFVDKIVTEMDDGGWVVLQDPKYNGFSTYANGEIDKSMNKTDCKKLV